MKKDDKDDDKELSKKEIKRLTKDIRKFNIFPHIKYKQVIINDEYYPYIISSYGHVYALHYKGKRNNFHEISQATNSSGYLHVTLTKNKKHNTVDVHRLIAEVFIKNDDPTKIQVNHKNGKKDKNILINLEWVTPSENIKHAYHKKLAHSLCGEDSGLSKYSNDQIKEVCEMLEHNISFKKITEKTGVDRGMIYYIYNGKFWKSISKDYDFSKYTYGKPKDRKKKIHKVCKMLAKNKYTIKEISESTGISRYTINDILNGDYYTNISSKYKISNFEKYKPRKHY